MNEGIDIKRVQQRLLSMAVEIRNVLEKNSIPYQIAFGTLLGAVRHGGFIPWDDDFDFFLFDDSYERAIEALKKGLPTDLFVEDATTEPNFFHGWSRVKDLGTEAYCDYYEQDNSYAHHGLCVDLFRIKMLREKEFSQYRYDEAMAYINRRRAKGIISIEEYQERIDSFKIRKEKEASDSGKVILAYPFDVGKQLPEDVFPLKRIVFEEYGFWGPNKAENVLKMRYGKWEELPPKEERKTHYSKVVFK